MVCGRLWLGLIRRPSTQKLGRWISTTRGMDGPRPKLYAGADVLHLLAFLSRWEPAAVLPRREHAEIAFKDREAQMLLVREVACKG